MFGFKISSRFIAAVFGAGATVVSDYKNPTAWMTAIGIVFAASAPGIASSKQPGS